MCSPCRSWTMAVCVAGTSMMLPSSRPHTSRPWDGMYTLAVTLMGSLELGRTLSWSMMPAGDGMSLSKASWRLMLADTWSSVRGTEVKASYVHKVGHEHVSVLVWELSIGITCKTKSGHKRAVCKLKYWIHTAEGDIELAEAKDAKDANSKQFKKIYSWINCIVHTVFN